MKIGLAGLGFMGATHARAWAQVPGAELAAVMSRDERKLTGDLSSVRGNLESTSAQLDFGDAARYRSLAEMLEDPRIEIVDVCLPTDKHADAVRRALVSGRHVVVEKPLALQAPEARELASLARERGLALMSGHILRFLAPYVHAREMVQSGELGTLREAILRRRCATPQWSDWLGDAERSGGGVFDLLIHDVDFALWMWGIPQAVSATGISGGSLDTVTARLHYKDGPQVTITGGWYGRNPYPFSMQFTLLGESGVLEMENGLKHYSSTGEQPISLPETDGFIAELAYFHDCVVQGHEPARCPAEESAEAVAVLRAILESRKRGGERVACETK